MNSPIFKFALREDVKDQPQFLPTQATKTDTGYDVKACPIDRKPIIVKPGEYCKVPLGFRCFIEDGWWYELKPRSSSFVKKFNHTLLGTIDQDFNMEAHYCFMYLPPIKLETLTKPLYGITTGAGQYKSETIYNAPDLKIEFGEALGQIIPVKRQEMIVESISNEEIEEMYKKRNAVRNGGFGSSDNKGSK